MNRQSGFTLIELLLSFTLGLIITAAAILLFFTSQRSLLIQKGVSDIQDNANFGLNYITKDLRVANLNNTKSIINDETAYSGIVLTSSINAFQDTKTIPPTPLSNLNKSIIGTTANVNLLSRSQGAGMTPGTAPMWTGVSNVQINGVDQLSDQLVIQYIPQYTVDAAGNFDGGFDCEGNALRFTAAVGRQVIVQRYFLREDASRETNEPNLPLALACDAGRYPVVGNPAQIINYNDAGEIVMKRVDHFRVLFGVQHQTNNERRYVSVNDYMNLALPRPRIVSVQLGFLVRSSETVGAESTVKDDQNFTILDQTVKVKNANQTTKYIRQVVSQNIALRNAIGERGT